MSEVKKVKMVFVGGKNSPSSYNLGEVYELTETHLKFPWFIAAPEDADVGAIVDYTPAKSEAKTEASLARASMPVIPPGLKGIFKMQFDGRVKSAPGTFGFEGRTYKLETGMMFELPASYARFPWWRLVDPLPEVLIPDIELDTVYEEAVFIPPEAVDEPGEVVSLEEVIKEGDPATDDQPDAEPEEVPKDESEEKPEEAAQPVGEETDTEEEKTLAERQNELAQRYHDGEITSDLYRELSDKLNKEETPVEEEATDQPESPEEVPFSEVQLKAKKKEDIKREMRDRGITYDRFDTKDELIQKFLKHYAPA